MEETKQIHRQMTIEEILSFSPSKAQKMAHAMTKAGLHCAGCHAATWETLEAGMLGHGMSDQQIDRLEAELNSVLSEVSDPDTISMTPRAAQKYLEILAEEGKEGWGLRLDEEMRGCSGFEYLLDFSKSAQSADQIFISQGIEIHVRKDLVQHMLGSEIDYVEGLNQSGFKVSNPNVRSSCGCGSSYNY